MEKIFSLNTLKRGITMRDTTEKATEQSIEENKELAQAWKEWGYNYQSHKPGQAKPNKKHVNNEPYIASMEQLEQEQSGKRTKQVYQVNNTTKAVNRKRNGYMYDPKHKQSLESTMFDTTKGTQAGEAPDSGYTPKEFMDIINGVDAQHNREQRLNKAINKQHKKDVKIYMKLLTRKRNIVPTLRKLLKMDEKALLTYPIAKVEHYARMLYTFNMTLRKPDMRWVVDKELNNWLERTNSRLLVNDPEAEPTEREAIVIYLKDHFYFGTNETRKVVNVVEDDIQPVRTMYQDFKRWAEDNNLKHGKRASKQRFEKILLMAGCEKFNLTDYKDRRYMIDNKPVNTKDLTAWTCLTSKELTERNILEFEIAN